MGAEQAEVFNKSRRRKLKHSQMDWSRQGRRVPHLLSVAAIPDLSASPHLTYVYVNVCLSMFTLKAGGLRLNARPYNKLDKVLDAYKIYILSVRNRSNITERSHIRFRILSVTELIKQLRISLIASY